MSLNQIELNLLVLLDPGHTAKADEWRSIRPQELRDADARFKSIRHRDRNLVFSFQRGNLVGYLYCCLTAWLEARKHNKTVRRLLYINDGLLSSIFATSNATGYRAFARNHLPHPDGIRRQLASLLPPFWRAEQRFVTLEQRTPPDAEKQPDQLTACDYLFFSNQKGKLMLTQAKTFISGNGLIFKTTATPGYAASLQHEQSVVQNISQLLQQPAMLRGPQEPLPATDRVCFSEAYLSGRNLREVLRLWGKAGASIQACQLLEGLDNWFQVYCSAFKADKQSLSVLYEPMLQSFAEQYADNPDSMAKLQLAQHHLARLEQDRNGVIPITAHNDLWPGNFILHDNQLTAIDWERATEQSSPLFDYFWMTIAAVLEYYVGKSNSQDYSQAFRQFLGKHDEVSRHAHYKLEAFLERLGLNNHLFSTYLLLFLMEWSLQGFRALGRTTDMDRLAHAELAAFSPDQQQCSFSYEPVG